MTSLAWTLVAHLAGMVLWIGGLLFAALAGGAVTGGTGETGAAALAPLAVNRERARLAGIGLRRFAHPGAALMILTGAWMMVLLPAVRTAPWLHAKLTLVVVLIVVDLVLSAKVRGLPDRLPARAAWRSLQGAIAALFVAILILVLVRPF